MAGPVEPASRVVAIEWNTGAWRASRAFRELDLAGQAMFRHLVEQILEAGGCLHYKTAARADAELECDAFDTDSDAFVVATLAAANLLASDDTESLHIPDEFKHLAKPRYGNP